MRYEDSPYLNQLAARNQSLASVEHDQSIKLASQEIERLRKQLTQGQALDKAEVVASLREAKGRMDLALFDLESLGQSHDFITAGKLRSEFAGLTIDLALLEAWHWARNKGLLSPDAPDHVSGLFVLGMGKLGGYDLNFSSDVDLIAFFDPQLMPIARHEGRVEVAGRMLKRMGNTLTDPLAEGANGAFVWRVDWRLRPDPSVNPLAIGFEAGLDYYFYHSAPWERLALAKARSMAGDIPVGERFLKELEPYIWKRNLDFVTLREISALKQTIHARHPSLGDERKRKWQHKGNRLRDWTGYNLKLGVGGIREIEFLVQAMQMVWGGREPRVRERHTLSAIAALVEEKHLSGSDADVLVHAYEFLRRSENAVQSYRNGQDHQIPKEEAQHKWLLSTVGALSEADYVANLSAHTRSVSKLFDSLLNFEGPADSQSLEAGFAFPEEIDTVENDIPAAVLSSRSLAIARSSRGKHAFERLKPRLLKIANRTSDPLAAAKVLHAFLAQLSPSSGYLETLERYPHVLETLARALLHAPNVALLAKQSPHMIDRLVAGEPGDLRQLFRDQAKSAGNKEVWLERLRRLVNEELFATYCRVLMGEIELDTAQNNLTRLAHAAIETQLREVLRDLGHDPDNDTELPLAVIAMGKLGMGRMAPLSDLDLILVNLQPQVLEDPRRAMSRFITGMTAQMKEGIAYEIDLRLRPNGRSGPPAVSLSAFEKHHESNAKTWEHLALSAGRILRLKPFGAGQQELQQAFARVLTRERHMDQFWADSARMWQRLIKHKLEKSQDDPAKERFDIKLRRGGLMAAEYLLSVETVAHAPRNPELLRHSHDDRWALLGRPNLGEAIAFWRRAQWAVRLLNLDKIDQPSREQIVLFLRITQCESLEVFDQMAQGWADQVAQAVDQALPRSLLPADLDNYAEHPVRWTDTGMFF